MVWWNARRRHVCCLLAPGEVGTSSPLAAADGFALLLRARKPLHARPSLLRWQYFLNADLVNEVISSQVSQVRSLLIIRQMGTDAVDHHHDQSAVVHVEPVGSTDQLVSAVADKWAVGILGQVRLKESGHLSSASLGAPILRGTYCAALARLGQSGEEPVTAILVEEHPPTAARAPPAAARASRPRSRRPGRRRPGTGR